MEEGRRIWASPAGLTVPLNQNCEAAIELVWMPKIWTSVFNKTVRFSSRYIVNFAFLHATHGTEVVLFHHFTHLGIGSCMSQGSPEKQNQQDVYMWKELQFKVQRQPAGRIPSCSGGISLLFFSGLQLINWGPPHYGGQSALFRLHWCKCKSHLETPSHKDPE